VSNIEFEVQEKRKSVYSADAQEPKKSGYCIQRRHRSWAAQFALLPAPIIPSSGTDLGATLVVEVWRNTPRNCHESVMHKSESDETRNDVGEPRIV